MNTEAQSVLSVEELKERELLQDTVTKRMVQIVVKTKMYTIYKYSPPVLVYTKAYLTLNSFENDGDDGGPLQCHDQYRSDDMPVVMHST